MCKSLPASLIRQFLLSNYTKLQRFQAFKVLHCYLLPDSGHGKQISESLYTNHRIAIESTNPPKRSLELDQTNGSVHSYHLRLNYLSPFTHISSVQKNLSTYNGLLKESFTSGKGQLCLLRKKCIYFYCNSVQQHPLLSTFILEAASDFMIKEMLSAPSKGIFKGTGN